MPMNHRITIRQVDNGWIVQYWRNDYSAIGYDSKPDETRVFHFKERDSDSLFDIWEELQKYLKEKMIIRD